uniref:Major facilitator superfamily (MFS) profile domain-containing protein n=1 Tax=Acrobeloides nanus TaxID=290746 RepID=A0A914E8M5_9BILA
MVQVVTVLSENGIARQPTHKPELGWFVYLLAGTAVIGGFLFGYDTGVVSAAMLYVPKNNGMTPMSDFWKELIVSITPGFASIGALFGSAASDHFGRKKVILLSSFLFAIGAIVCGAAFDKWLLLLGRILIGVGLAMRLNPRNIVKLIEDHFRFHPETEVTAEERGLAERLIFQIQRHLTETDEELEIEFEESLVVDEFLDPEAFIYESESDYDESFSDTHSQIDSEENDPEFEIPAKRQKEQIISRDQIQTALSFYRSGSGGTRSVSSMNAKFRWIKDKDQIDNILL